MSKEKVNSLTKYQQDVRNKLSSPTPDKHKNNPKTYQAYLERELQVVTKSLAALKETAPTK